MLKLLITFQFDQGRLFWSPIKFYFSEWGQGVVIVDLLALEFEMFWSNLFLSLYGTVNTFLKNLNRTPINKSVCYFESNKWSLILDWFFGVSTRFWKHWNTLCTLISVNGYTLLLDGNVMSNWGASFVTISCSH